jgi:hypothetical protein
MAGAGPPNPASTAVSSAMVVNTFWGASHSRFTTGVRRSTSNSAGIDSKNAPLGFSLSFSISR